MALYLTLDVGLFFLAVLISYQLPYRINGGSFLDWEHMVAFHDLTSVLLILPVLVLTGSGVYKVAWFRAKVEDFGLIFRSIALADVLLLATVYVLRAEQAGIDRMIGSWPASSFLYLLPIASLMLCGWRVLLRLCVEAEFLSGGRTQRMIVIGLRGVSDEVLRRIVTNRNPGYEIVASFDRSGETLAGVPGFADLARLPELLDQRMADTVLISTAGVDQNDLFAVVQLCERHQMEYQVLPTHMDLMATQSRVDLINFVPMLTYSEPRITGWPLFFKMFFDLAVSGLALVVLAGPFVVLSIAISLDSRGWPLFLQTRVGRYGKPFRIFKFRTMVAGAQDRGPLTRDNDDRITRVGHFLRKWSIDELPQLINVFFGQMSIIGPRAVVPEVASRFDEWEKISLNVLPGITGLAQVYGRNRLSLVDKSFLSVYYIRNYSILLDLKILMRTIVTVLKGSGEAGTPEAGSLLSDANAEVEGRLFDDPRAE